MKVSEYGYSCFQARPNSSAVKCPSTPFTDIIADDLPRPGGPLPGNPRGATQSEDCLFADIYVPLSAFSTPVPVVNWVYGGAYVFGVKDTGWTNNLPYYDAKGLMRIAEKTGQKFIFIAGNYRLGAFGWLAGPTMEKVSKYIWKEHAAFPYGRFVKKADDRTALVTNRTVQNSTIVRRSTIR